MQALRGGQQPKICPEFDQLRERARKELDELKVTRVKMKVKFNEDLEKAFLNAYFKPAPKCVGKLEVLKRFSLQLAITNTKNSQLN